MAAFDDALAVLTPAMRAQVEAQLARWNAHPDWQQIGANLQAESALPQDVFCSLLTRFAEALGLDSIPSPESTWRTTWCSVCKTHELRGAVIPLEARPSVLGRAWSVGAFARSISQASGDLSEDDAARAIRRHAGRQPPNRVCEQVRLAPLGGAVIWATFNASDAAGDPFTNLPDTAETIACALGLGYHRGELVALVYRTAPPEHGHPIHRPTVADANSYSYYRPHPDATSPHGYTMPLAPGVTPMPEVVHATITGAALVYPYRIFA